MEESTKMSDTAMTVQREYKRQYMREWRAKNKDKVAANNRRYWERRVAKVAETDNENGVVEDDAHFIEPARTTKRAISLMQPEKVKAVVDMCGGATAFADMMDCSRKHVYDWMNGVTAVRFELVKSICEKCSVSADYLLGYSDDPSMRRTAIDELGLSPDAVGALVDMKNAGMKEELGFVSDMICNSYFRRQHERPAAD